jgi:hypothetical protein
MKMRKLIVGLGLLLTGWAAYADLSLSTTFVNFFGTPVGSYGPTTYVHIRNSGQDAVSVREYSTCGQDFRVYSYCNSQLEPGEQCPIGVQFTPRREGYLNCVIYLSDGQNQYSISARGQGVRR